MRTIYFGGRVYTGAGVHAEAFAVENGAFVAVGGNEQMKATARAGDEMIDLHGRFVCAGFNDSHMHLLGYGNSLRTARLGEHTDSLHGMIDYFAAFAKEHPPARGAWLLGRGWNQDYFSDAQRMPGRDDLDRVSREFPVVAVRCCGHCMAVNSCALEALQLCDCAPIIDGGRVGMENGRLDGRFYDNAMDIVYNLMPSPGKQEIKEMILSACAALNACAVTGSQTDDFLAFHGVKWQTVNEAYRELATSGQLSVRVYEQCNFTDLPALHEFYETEWSHHRGDGIYRLGPLKLLGDGALGARTAYLSRPYADAPDTRGIPVFSQQTLDEMIGYAHAKGMQIAVHAIGDACLDRVLNAYQKALAAHPRDDHRHGIIHCQITRADQLQTMIDMKLHIYAQSVFLDYDNRIVERRVGQDLARTSYAWKTLADGGLSVSNGTDCPVERPDPRRGIQCAVTRTTLDGSVGPYLPKQRFTVSEALDSYTLRGAEASFEERVKGRITPGMLADFVVLTESPFAVDPSAISDIAVLQTCLGGRRVFDAK